VLQQVQFRFVEYPPTARTIARLVERSSQLEAKRRIRPGMPRGRPGMRNQTAVDDLADDVFRQIEKVCVRSGFLLRQSHGGFRSSTAHSVARIDRPGKTGERDRHFAALRERAGGGSISVMSDDGISLRSARRRAAASTRSPVS
jgi:hypothetical protein